MPLKLYIGTPEPENQIHVSDARSKGQDAEADAMLPPVMNLSKIYDLNGNDVP